MAQYSIYKKEVPKYWVDPDTGLRTREWIHNNYWQTDYELVTGGFLLAEGVGWVTAESDGTEVTGATGREGVRDAYYVKDVEITPAGFGGEEGDILGDKKDWVNINGAY